MTRVDEIQGFLGDDSFAVWKMNRARYGIEALRADDGILAWAVTPIEVLRALPTAAGLLARTEGRRHLMPPKGAPATCSKALLSSYA